MTKKNRRRKPKHARYDVYRRRDDEFPGLVRWVIRGVPGRDLSEATQREAIATARRRAYVANNRCGQVTSIRIHGRDGKIRDEVTIPRQRDPFPPRG